MSGLTQYEDRGYQVRVFRRRNLKDYRDFQDSNFTMETLQAFVTRSTFIGPGPDIVRELSTENAMKIFTYNKPVLILFRNTSAADARYYDK
jgi:hypothetical protein